MFTTTLILTRAARGRFFVRFRAAANQGVDHLGRRQVKERVLQPSFGQAAQYVGPPPGCVAEAVRTVLVAVHDASTMSGTRLLPWSMC